MKDAGDLQASYQMHTCLLSLQRQVVVIFKAAARGFMIKSVRPALCGRGSVPGTARRGRYLGKSELCPEAAGGAAWHRRPLTALLLQIRSAKIEEGDGAGGGSTVAPEGVATSHGRGQAAVAGSTAAVCLGQRGL